MAIAEVTEQVTVAGDLLSISQIIWRRFKKPMPGLIERTFEINPHLAALGIYPPAGTVFLLPVPTDVDASREETLDPVRLW